MKHINELIQKQMLRAHKNIRIKIVKVNTGSGNFCANTREKSSKMDTNERKKFETLLLLGDH